MIKGVYRNGQVELAAPVDWPEGNEVDVSPRQFNGGGAPKEKWGMDESEWPTTPEGIEALIARMDSREPVELTPEEERAWNEGLRFFGEYTREQVRKQMGLDA
jgi:hypothetical protein